MPLCFTGQAHTHSVRLSSYPVFREAAAGDGFWRPLTAEEIEQATIDSVVARGPTEVDPRATLKEN